MIEYREVLNRQKFIEDIAIRKLFDSLLISAINYGYRIIVFKDRI